MRGVHSGYARQLGSLISDRPDEPDPSSYTHSHVDVRMCGAQEHDEPDTGAMARTSGDPAASARAEVVGQKITGVFFLHDFIEVHIEDVILTGMTKPFGMIGCQGVGPASIVSLIGRKVEDLTVVDGEYVAIDSGENRLAFPIGGESSTGPESVMLVRPAHQELGIPQATWIW
jgi:hypothetical protein